MDGWGEKPSIGGAGGGGAEESAEKRMAGDGEVQCVDCVDPEELADEVAAAFAVEGADMV